MEKKVFPFECKVDMDKNTFEGYFSIKGNIDAGNDRVMGGAFTKTFQENRKRIKGLYMHDIKKPFSKPIEIYEDSKGAYVKGSISLCSWGQDLKILMSDGIVDEMSFGYDTIKYDNSKENGEIIRNLRELKVWEYSPVTWGMNSDTNITNVKELDRFNNLIDELKLGRSISNRNKNSIQEAINALMALLEENEPLDPDDIPEMESDGNTQEPEKSQKINIDSNIFQSILSEAKKYI